MASRGVKKKKSKYKESTRIENKRRRLEKHLMKYPNDKDAKNALP